eukprot:GSMAST32.ASY1.ANO1.2060.1 assembled CDS
MSYDTASVKQMKQALSAKGVDYSKCVEKQHLRELLKENVEPHEFVKLLRQYKKGTASSQNTSTKCNNNEMPSLTTEQLQSQADQLKNANPGQLRMQAHMLKTQPDAVRRQNPQLAHLTNEQLCAQAKQMEMLADNPNMVKMMADRMKNMTASEFKAQQEKVSKMTPAQIQAMQAGMSSGMSSGTSSNSTTSVPSSSTIGSQFDFLAGMNGQQLKEYFKTVASSLPATSSGADKMQVEAMKKYAEMFAAMDPNTLYKFMSTGFNLLRVYRYLDGLCFGYFRYCIPIILLCLIYLLFKLCVFIYMLVVGYIFGEYSSNIDATTSPPSVVEDTIGSTGDEFDWEL